MAEYPELTKADIARFSGRPRDSYASREGLVTALAQATLLFKIATCRSEFPDDPREAELATAAISAYADFIYLRLPFAKALASPFSSESLGSYSYSKSAASAARGDKTDIMWFDLAVSRLGQCDLAYNIPTHGGIEMFEYDIPLLSNEEGMYRALSPQDIQWHNAYVHDPAPLSGL